MVNHLMYIPVIVAHFQYLHSLRLISSFYEKEPGYEALHTIHCAFKQCVIAHDLHSLIRRVEEQCNYNIYETRGVQVQSL